MRGWRLGVFLLGLLILYFSLSPKITGSFISPVTTISVNIIGSIIGISLLVTSLVNFNPRELVSRLFKSEEPQNPSFVVIGEVHAKAADIYNTPEVKKAIEEEVDKEVELIRKYKPKRVFLELPLGTVKEIESGKEVVSPYQTEALRKIIQTCREVGADIIEMDEKALLYASHTSEQALKREELMKLKVGSGSIDKYLHELRKGIEKIEKLPFTDEFADFYSKPWRKLENYLIKPLDEVIGSLSILLNAPDHVKNRYGSEVFSEIKDMYDAFNHVREELEELKKSRNPTIFRNRFKELSPLLNSLKGTIESVTYRNIAKYVKDLAKFTTLNARERTWGMYAREEEISDVYKQLLQGSERGISIMIVGNDHLRRGSELLKIIGDITSNNYEVIHLVDEPLQAIRNYIENYNKRVRDYNPARK
ncbi:MAG: hypothetical protein KQA38_02480 [Candidatus Aenigmarchaeota archaeon]|nr:hypothetical protein [Candidatus Aenigmarchaeota archaeon]